MSLIDPTRVFNNLIVLGILLGIGIMIYSKMDKEKVKSLIEGIKGMFGGKKDGS